MDNDKKIDKDLLFKILDDMGQELAKLELVAEIAIFGGSALVNLFDLRVATNDVDYIPLAGNPNILEEIAQKLALKYKLNKNWFNDNVNIFISDNQNFEFVGDFPRNSKIGLRVYRPSNEYILAMKCMALRDVLSTSDFEDVWNLIDLCEISDIDKLVEVISQYYPMKRIKPRNILLLKDLLSEKKLGNKFKKEKYW